MTRDEAIGAQSARCEPPAEHRAKRWHWLQAPGDRPEVAHWSGGRWTSSAMPVDGINIPPEQAAHHGWRYVGPCEEPSEIPKIDLAWEAVNALGGKPVTFSPQESSYLTAISYALGEIEKLGGKDPAPMRALHAVAYDAVAEYLASIAVRTEMIRPWTFLASRALSVEERKIVDDLRPAGLLIEDPVAPAVDFIFTAPGHKVRAEMRAADAEPHADDGGPAFPHTAAQGHRDYRCGMSLRDWFAGQALNGLCACTKFDAPTAADFCAHAYRFADAMLAERAKGSIKG